MILAELNKFIPIKIMLEDLLKIKDLKSLKELDKTLLYKSLRVQTSSIVQTCIAGAMSLACLSYANNIKIQQNKWQNNTI